MLDLYGLEHDDMLVGNALSILQASCLNNERELPRKKKGW